ncbi:MAG: tetratricopeptide repeat protein [Acidobacteriota bacterium]
MSTRKIVVAAFAVLVAAAALNVAYVPGHQIAVRESLGGQAVALRAGLHLRVPIYHRLYRYDTRPVTIDEGVAVVTAENATFRLPIRIAAWPSPGDILTFHEGCSGRDPTDYVKGRVREGLRAAAKEMSADALLDSKVERALGPALSSDLISRGIADDGLEVGRPSPQVVLNAVLDYLKRQFPASARRLAERALASDPAEPLHQTAMGIVLEAEGDPDAAEAAYLEALYADPAAAEPMSRLYVLYQSRSDSESIRRLERLLTAGLDKDPSSAVHHHWLGQLFMRTGRVEDADNAFRTAIGLAPENPDFRVSLGGLRVRENRIDEARAAFRKALELREDHPLALFNMGVTYALEADFDAAIDYFHRAERSGPANHALYNSLAQAYEEKGDLARAADYLRRSLRLRPDQPERRSALRRIEAALKEKS